MHVADQITFTRPPSCAACARAHEEGKKKLNMQNVTQLSAPVAM